MSECDHTDEEFGVLFSVTEEDVCEPRSVYCGQCGKRWAVGDLAAAQRVAAEAQAALKDHDRNIETHKAVAIEAMKERDAAEADAQALAEALEFYIRGHECLDGKTPTPSCPGLLKARTALANHARRAAQE